MNELIKIEINEEGRQLVSARELYNGLGAKTPFHKWITRMIEYGFEEDKDYTVTDFFVPNSKGGKQTQKDFIITLDMAKEISMIQRNDTGKKFRQYFIECEKKLKEVVLIEQQKANLLLSIYNGGQVGVLASRQLAEMEVKEATKPLLDKIENDKPLVTFADRILNKGDNILVRELAKIISDEGYSIGQNRLYEVLREWKLIFKKSTEPMQIAIDKGYFVRETSLVRTPYGLKESFTTKVTPKGQVYVTERILKEKWTQNIK